MHNTIYPGGPRADKLQEANITILEFDTCLKLYGGVIRSSMMCAGQEAGGVDACQVQYRILRAFGQFDELSLPLHKTSHFFLFTFP